MLELAPGEVADGEARALSQRALHQEGGAQVADVVDGGIEEGVADATALFRHPQDVTSRGAVSGDECGPLKAIERPVGERSRQGPDPADVPLRGEVAHEVPSVDPVGMLGDEAEAGRLGEGEWIHPSSVGEIVNM